MAIKEYKTDNIHINFNIVDSDGSYGTSGQVLSRDAGGVTWADGSGSGIIGGPYLPIAGGTMTGNTDHNDNVYSKYGTADQLRIWNNGSNSYIFNYTSGNINIGNDAADKDVIFYADRGEGLEGVFFRLDGSETNGTTVLGVTLFPDKSQARFGNQGDLRIYHDGSNSYIQDTGTGTLNLQGSTQVLLGGTNGEVGVQYVENAGVGLRHNNVTKLTTESTGVTVTGDADISGQVTVGTSNSIFAEDVLRFNSTGTAFIDHTTVGATINFRVSNSAVLDTTALTIEGSGNSTFGTQAFATTATSSGDGSSTLTTKGYVDSLITGATIYRGTWDPDVSLNSGYGNPNLNTVTQTSGYYYICSADGAATPNGTGNEPNSWNTGDWVIWNDDIGTSGEWQKIDNSSVLSGVGTGQTVALWQGASSVTDSETLGNAPITVSGNNTTFAGDITTSGNIYLNNNKTIFGKNTSGSNYGLLTITSGNIIKLGAYSYTSAATEIGLGDNGKFLIGTAEALSIDSSKNATFAGNVTLTDGTLTVGADAAGRDVMFRGGTSGAYFSYDASEDGVVIVAPTDEVALGIRVVGGGQPTVPQFTVGRGTSQYLGIKVDDRISQVIHRQDETDAGIMQMNQEIWDSGTGVGKWNWRYADGAGASASTKMTLNKTGELNVSTSVTSTTFLGDLNGTINTATTGITQSAGNNSTLIATTAYADAAAAAVPIGNYLPLTAGASYPLTGDLYTEENIIFNSTTGNTINSIVNLILNADSDQNSGDAYRNIIFQNRGSEKMRIIADGNVGIGITGPLTKLHVFEAGTAMIRVDSGATAPYKAGIEFLRSSVNGGRIYNDGNAVQVKLESDFAYDAANPSRGGFQFKTAPTTSGTLVDAVRIDARGYVGIGTTNPGSKLEISSSSDALLELNGGTTANPYMLFAQNGTRRAFIQYVNGGLLSLASEYGDIRFMTGTGGTETEKMRITSTGNVGIGTTSPSSQLSLGFNNVGYFGMSYDSNANPYILSNAYLDGITPKLKSTGYGADASAIRMAGDSILFNIWDGTNADETITWNTAMAVASGGNVGIGTTSPGEKLTVHSTATAIQTLYTTNTQGGYTGYQNSTGGVKGFVGYGPTLFTGLDINNFGLRSQSGMPFATGGGNVRMYINSTGNVGIGTTAPSQKLHVAGNLRVTGAYYDSNNSPGTANQVLVSTVSGTDWIDGSAIPGVPAGSGTLNTIPLWTPDGDTLGDSIITQPTSTEVRVAGTLKVDSTVTGYTSTKIQTGGFGDSQSGINILNSTTGYGYILFGDGSGADLYRGQIAYKHGDDYMAFNTAGSERMRIDSSGRLLINATSTVFSDKFYINSDAYSTGGWRVGSASTYVGKIRNNAGKLEIVTDTNRDIQFGDAGTPNIMYIDTSAENVGIGTTSPGYKLTVNGDVDVNNGAILAAQAYGINLGVSGYDIVMPTTTRIAIKTSSSERVSILNNGNVGIGTTSPAQLLSIYKDSGDANFLINSNNGASQIFFGDTESDNIGRIDYDHSDNSLNFAVNAAERMRITSLGGISFGSTGTAYGTAGQVLTSAGNASPTWTTPSSGGTIGGSIASTQLALGSGTANEIQGSSKLTFTYVSGGLGYDKFKIGDGSTGSNQVLLDINTLGAASSRGRLTLSDAGTLRGYLGITGGDTEVTLLSNANLILDSGSTDDVIITTNSGSNVGIGNTAPTYKLDVTGTGRFTSTVTATNFILSSDKRLKDNIKNIDNDHIDVDWKNFELKSEPGIKRSGVIAQELEEKHPEFVRTDKEGLKSVAYIDLLIAKIAELEARLEIAGI